MKFKGETPSVWVGKANQATDQAAARLNRELRGKTIIRVEGRGDQVVFFFHDNTNLSLNCEGGFKEVS